MRKELKKLCGTRTRFKGEVVSFGIKTGYKGRSLETMLLKNVTLITNDDVLTDHQWINCGKWSESVSEGDVIEFDARVKKYTKGYQGYRYDLRAAHPPSIDYCLAYPTKVKILKK